MNLNDIIKGDIKDYCIACLEKDENMLSLIENTEKQQLFKNLFNIELNNFKEYPHYLCCACDIKLNETYNFFQSVRQSLETLHEYHKQIKQPKYSDKELNESVGIIREKNDCNDTSKPKIVNSEEVERVIKEFKNKYSGNKTCIICGFIAANRRSLSSHMAIFHKDIKNSWCLDCNNIFENYEEHKQCHNIRQECPLCEKKITPPHFLEHLQSHSGVFDCKECKKTFKSSAWLSKHMRIHTNEKPYVCPNCSKGFIQLSSLKYHLNTHGKYACDSCKKHYRSDKELEEHECRPKVKGSVKNEIWINSDGAVEFGIEPAETIIIKGAEVISSSDQQNFCKDCNKRVKSLSQHIRKYHSLIKEEKIVKSIKCEFCQKLFNNMDKLRNHTRLHTGHLPYKCKYCDKRLLTRSRLKDHERTHTGEKPYICSICGKGLSQSSALRTHMRQHTGRPEVCSLCSKTFCRKSELKLHLSKHMGEKPFLCTECGKTFAQKSHLSEHMAGHSEERPFSCPHCEKGFKTKNLLKEHLKLHQGYKPFKCPFCPYACYKAYRLQQHMKQHSNECYEKNESSEPIAENQSGDQPIATVTPTACPHDSAV